MKREKLKTRRPPARPSAVLLKNTKPSRPSRGIQTKILRKTPLAFFKPLLAWISVTSAVKALDSLSIGRRPTHGNDGDFFNSLIFPLYLALLS
ncbi:hypothetical protein C2L89_09095 [Coxiella burnetii]|nr:hypothetical protein C2L89_09095 [Coxiella burnetii]